MKKVNALTPEEFSQLTIEERKEYAAGWPAVVSSIEHVSSEMGTAKWFSSLLKMNQKGGFDCSGCAWPDPDNHRSGLGEYCENGAKAFAEEATDKKIGRWFFEENSIEFLSKQTDFWLGKSGRLTSPMHLKEGATHYTPISWADAFSKIGTTLNGLKSPDEAIFYTSGRTSNEAAFLYQLFVRQFGTNNLPDCSNMCHESSGVALGQSVGIGKGSVTLDDFNHAEVIMVIGQNPGTNHPRMLAALADAKKNGAKIITVNPLPEAGLARFKNPQNLGDLLGSGTSLTDLFLQVKINGDLALLKAINKGLDGLDQKSGTEFDHTFIKEKTAGFEAFIESTRSANLQELSDESGISTAQIAAAVEMLSGKSKIIVCWAMGITQHVNGVENIREIVNLLLSKGSIGKQGAGTCPVRGHSNVQGDRTMGIYEKPALPFLERLDEHFNITTPKHHGHDVVDAIKAMHEGSAKVFFGMGGNFLSAASDTEFTGEALQNCDLTVHVSTKLNRSHVVHGKEAIILPCLVRSEEDIQDDKPQFVSVENSMGVVHSSTGHLTPASAELKSEVNIVCELAQATISGAAVDWSKYRNYDLIRQDIEAVIPGFGDYNTRVRIPEGFYLPNGARDGVFNTPNKKANFMATVTPKNSLAADELYMMTVRSHDQYNTTIYGLDDRYRGVFNERRVVFMNQEDIAKRGLSTESIVDLISEYDGKTRRVNKFKIVPFDIPATCVATYFPETNPLVPINLTAKHSNTPASKLIKIKIVEHGQN